MRGFLSYFLILSLSISSFSLSTGAPNGITSSKLEMKTLEVAYLFEEGKGKTAEDISPNKRHATLVGGVQYGPCLLYTSPSPRDRTRSRMPSSA